MTADSGLLGIDRRKTHLEGLRHSLQVTDRVLSGRDLKVVWDNSTNGFPAFSTKSEITINLAIADPFTEEGMATVLGLNYHEVAHVVYSPDSDFIMRAGDAYLEKHKRYVTGKGFDHAYSLLEEGRIETLYVNRYPRLGTWFTYPVVNILVKHQVNWRTAFLTTHGRRYLPDEIRKKFRDIFERNNGAEITEKLAVLIDRYRFLPVGQDSSLLEFAEIVYEFSDILAKTGNNPPAPHKIRPAGNGTGNEDVAEDAKAAEEKEKSEEEKNRPKEDEGAGERKRSSADPEAGPGEEDDPEESDGSGGGEDPEDEGDDASESGGGDVSEDADGGDDGDSSGGDSGGPDPGEPGGDDGDGGLDSPEEPEPGGREEPVPSVGAGRGKGVDNPAPPPPEVDRRALREELTEILKDLVSGSDAQEEIKTIRSAMEDPRFLTSTLDKSFTIPRRVTSDMVVNSEALADILQQIWTRMEPGWEYGTSEGSRLDMGRAAMARNPEDYDSIYDDWQPGQQDDSRIAAVVCADNSESTRSRVDRTFGSNSPTIAQVISKNIWELKNALQVVEATTTVLSFNSSCYTVYEREETVTAAEYKEIVPTGGTDPWDSLEEARRILTFAEEPKKVLVMVTDGMWSSYQQEEYKNTLDHMKSMGVVRVLILVGMTQFDYADLFDIVASTSGDIREPIAATVVHIMESSFDQ